MKNKRGFTLIELLITVVIMVSILAIAIVSVSNLSKKQKQNSYERVKDQVLTAATDYFSSNEYLFEKEELDTNGITIVTGYITLKSLVENGYLNVLTNPTDGTKLNECNYVKVTKDNGVTHLDYIEDNGCGMDNQITYNHIVKNCPVVNLSFNLNGTAGNGDWYKSDVVESVVSTTENGKNITLERTEDGNTISINNSSYDNTVSTEFDVREVKYKATSECGSSSETGKSYGIDKTPPEINKNSIKTGIYSTRVLGDNYDTTNPIWTNKDIKYDISINDNLALDKIKKEYIGGSIDITPTGNEYNYAVWDPNNEGKLSLKFTAWDEAGNPNSAEWIVKRDATPPTITYSAVSGKYSTSETPTTWNKDDVTFSVSAKDSHSGINPTSSKINNALFYVEWDSGVGSLNHYINSNGTKQAGGSSTEVVANITKSNGTYTRTNGGLGGEGKRWEIYKACDNAGNCGEKKIYVNIDKTKPTLSFNIKQNASTSSETAWSNKNASFDIIVKDELSGINITNNELGYDGKMVKQEWNNAGSKNYGNFNSVNVSSIGHGGNYTIKDTSDGKGYTIYDEYFSDEGARKGRYTVCDNAGNCNNNIIYTKIDKTPPYTPSPHPNILSNSYSAYKDNGYKYYQGLWCTLITADISNFNTFKSANDSWVPKLAAKNTTNPCGNGGKCFVDGAFKTSNSSNYRNQTEKNVYCTVKKKGNGGKPPQPTPLYAEDNLSSVTRYVKWFHDAEGPKEVTDWKLYDFDISYNSSTKRASYAIYMIKLKDEAGNESKTFRMDISPCYGNGNNKCADGQSNTSSWKEWNATTAKIN